MRMRRRWLPISGRLPLDAVWSGMCASELIAGVCGESLFAARLARSGSELSRVR